MQTDKNKTLAYSYAANPGRKSIRSWYYAGLMCSGVYVAMAHQYRGKPAIGLNLKEDGYRLSIRTRLLAQIYTKRTGGQLHGGRLPFCLGKLMAIMFRPMPMEAKLRKLRLFELKIEQYLKKLIHQEPEKNWNKIFRRTMPDNTDGQNTWKSNVLKNRVTPGWLYFMK